MHPTGNSERQVYRWQDGAISTEHSLSELRVIGSNVHREDSFFSSPNNAYLTYVVQLTLSLENPNCVDLIIPRLDNNIGHMTLQCLGCCR